MTDYGFRIRFSLPESIRLGIDEITWDVGDGVWMRSLVADQPINKASRLALRGGGFTSGSEASDHGERWRDALETAFARIGVGVDFGERSPRSTWTEAGLGWLAEQHGMRVLNDEPGLSVFELEPSPIFVGGQAKGVKTPGAERTKRAVLMAHELGPHHAEPQRLAYDLFSASFFQPAADARLLMLMMAVETLIVPLDRNRAAQEHVRELMRLTEAAELSASEKASLLGSLRWMLQESISQSGRRLADTLGARTYGDQTPKTFFTMCYSLRSRLVHGLQPPPAFEEVNQVVGQLERFVGHLLSGSLLDALPD